MAAAVVAVAGAASVGAWARLTPPVVAERSLFNVQPLYLPSWLPAGFRYAGVTGSPASEAAAQTTYRLGRTRIVWQDWPTGYPWGFDGRVISVGGRGVRYRLGMGLDDTGRGRDAVMRIRPSTVVRVWTDGPVAPRVLARVAASAVHVPASLQAPMPRFHVAQTQVYSPGSTIADVAVGDVTGDGRNDVLVTTGFQYDSPNNDSLFVYPQLRDGTLGAPTRLETGVSDTGVMPIVVGDFNGDGKTEVAVGAGPNIDVFEQQHGALTLAAQLPFAARELFVARLNGDRRSDLVTMGNRLVNGVWHQELDEFVSSGPTGLGFARQTLENLDNAGAMFPLAIGDINGDKRQDIVTFGHSTTDDLRLQAFLRQPNGGFAQRTIDARLPLAFAVHEETGALAIADLDSDHKPEIAFASFYTGSVFILHRQGTGLHYRVTDVSTGSGTDGATMFVATDVNRDGRTDLVEKGYWGSVAIHMQLPNKQMGIAIWSGGGYAADDRALAVGDVNNDGRPDLIYYPETSGFHVVYQAVH